MPSRKDLHEAAGQLAPIAKPISPVCDWEGCDAAALSAVLRAGERVKVCHEHYIAAANERANVAPYKREEGETVGEHMRRLAGVRAAMLKSWRFGNPSRETIVRNWRRVLENPLAGFEARRLAVEALAALRAERHPGEDDELPSERATTLSGATSPGLVASVMALPEDALEAAIRAGSTQSR